MARFFLLVTLVGGLSLFMYTTKPSQTDYLEKLQQRAAVLGASPRNAFQQIRSSDPLDEMVVAQKPEELVAQTNVDDYVVVSVFTTDYAAQGYGPRRVRVVGFFSSFIAYRVRDY